MSSSSNSQNFLRRLTHPAALLLLAGAILPLGRAEPAANAAPATITIAIVKDGSSGLIDGVEQATRQEVQTLTANRATIVFKEGGAFNAEWRDQAAATALDAALADPAVDYVITFGTRTTVAAAAANRPLNKPVLGAFLQESDLIALPIGADGRAQKKNFAVVALPSRAADQLADLRKLVPFSSLHVLVDPFYAPDDAALAAWRDGLARTLNTSITLVSVAARVDDTLAALGAARVVMLFPAVRMDAVDRAALLQGLAARKISALSFLGQADVEVGALAGVLPNPRALLVRRLAINLDQLIAGAPVEELPLHVTLPRQLFFNEATANAIGFSAGFEALNGSVFVGHYTPAAGKPLTLLGAIATALENNFDLRAQQSATDSARESEKSARGTLLPQVSLSQNFSQIDEDRAAASGGAQPESTVRGGFGLSQVVLDDEAFTRLKVARESRLGANELERAERLDAVNATGQAYLNLLAAQASLRVAEDNFQVTQRNLELATLRQRVGTSGPEEGYRFESLAAQQRSELSSARAQLDRARVDLNRILGVDIASKWDARDVTLEDPAFSFTTSRVIALVRDREQLERFRSFAAGYAAEHSPDVGALEQNVKAQRLTANERKRRPYLPKVTASVNYAHAFSQSYAGPSLADQFASAGIPVSTTKADRDDWTVGLSASVPIFSGGSLQAEARKARAELRRLELTRDGAREAVMAQAQASLYAAESSYGNIALSRRAADLAAKNLVVVQDKYERGAVSIVTLLDAQNSAFSQRQSADAATYKFLADLLQFQRSLGWIEAVATDAEKETWFRAMEQAVVR